MNDNGAFLKISILYKTVSFDLIEYVQTQLWLW